VMIGKIFGYEKKRDRQKEPSKESDEIVTIDHSS